MYNIEVLDNHTYFVGDEGLTARQRLALDIMDIKRLFGTKYNEGLRQLIDYAKSLPEFRKG